MEENAKILKEENINSNNRKEGEMKRQTKETINLISLVIGVVLIIVGLGGSAITIQAKSPIIIVPIISLILGAILALMGGLRKWG